MATGTDEIDAGPPAGYRFLREELRYEHALLGARMTYYVTSQSFLFTAAAIARGTHLRGFDWFSGALLPAVGAASSVVMLAAARAGYVRMAAWRARERRYEGTHPLVYVPTEAESRRGLMYATLMPWVFLAAWAVITVMVHAFPPPAGAPG